MSSSSGTVPVRRGRMRRVGESAFGVLLLVKQVVVALIASVVLVAGVWASWGTAQHVMLGKGRERGTLRVQSCGDEWCTGVFVPSGRPAEARGGMRVDAGVADGEGDRVPVVVKPDSRQTVRTGWAGVLRAWVPFGGSLMLAAVLVAGGMGFRRTGWVLGGLGAALLGGSFVALL
ncbi:hypothetical protein [Streptomyces pactum]|uniref:hypothetical protein n=1 Tax=Streptomyces pactum TaxID=68249 RepID=UPI0036FB84C6